MTKAHIAQDVTQSASVAKHTRGAAAITIICYACQVSQRPKLSRTVFRIEYEAAMILALPLVEQWYRRLDVPHKHNDPINIGVSAGPFDELVLQRSVSYMGTGHYVFLGLVSKEWQAACAAVGGKFLLRPSQDGRRVALGTATTLQQSIALSLPHRHV
jgi:hypothetical protein